jgi:prevent-host-death family protein
MKQIGMFEAKTRLSEICDEVSRSGNSVVITRRGKPLVKIDPVETDKFSVWEDRAKYIVRKGRMKKEFDLPQRSPELPASPLDD